MQVDKVGFKNLGVPEEHHDLIAKQLAFTPSTLKQTADAMGISVLQLLQLLITASPQIIALIQSIMALFNKPTPPVTK